MGIKHLAASAAKSAEIGFLVRSCCQILFKMLEDHPRNQVGEPMDNGAACGRQGWGLPCILVIGEAALAANLITRMIFKHLERNLAFGCSGTVWMEGRSCRHLT